MAANEEDLLDLIMNADEDYDCFDAELEKELLGDSDDEDNDNGAKATDKMEESRTECSTSKRIEMRNEDEDEEEDRPRRISIVKNFKTEKFNGETLTTKPSKAQSDNLTIVPLVNNEQRKARFSPKVALVQGVKKVAKASMKVNVNKPKNPLIGKFSPKKNQLIPQHLARPNSNKHGLLDRRRMDGNKNPLANPMPFPQRDSTVNPLQRKPFPVPDNGHFQQQCPPIFNQPQHQSFPSRNPHYPPLNPLHHQNHQPQNPQQNQQFVPQNSQFHHQQNLRFPQHQESLFPSPNSQIPLQQNPQFQQQNPLFPQPNCGHQQSQQNPYQSNQYHQQSFQPQGSVQHHPQAQFVVNTVTYQSTIQNPMQNPMENHMQHHMQNPLQNQMQNQMQSQMQNPLQNQMQNQMQNSMQNQMQNPMQNPMQNQMQSSYQTPPTNQLIPIQNQLIPLQNFNPGPAYPQQPLCNPQQQQQFQAPQQNPLLPQLNHQQQSFHNPQQHLQNQSPMIHMQTSPQNSHIVSQGYVELPGGNSMPIHPSYLPASSQPSQAQFSAPLVRAPPAQTPLLRAPMPPPPPPLLPDPKPKPVVSEQQSGPTKRLNIDLANKSITLNRGPPSPPISRFPQQNMNNKPANNVLIELTRPTKTQNFNNQQETLTLKPVQSKPSILDRLEKPQPKVEITLNPLSLTSLSPCLPSPFPKEQKRQQNSDDTTKVDLEEIKKVVGVDAEYMKKLEEQKRKREELLAKRAQRFGNNNTNEQDSGEKAPEKVHEKVPVNCVQSTSGKVSNDSGGNFPEKDPNSANKNTEQNAKETQDSTAKSSLPNKTTPGANSATSAQVSPTKKVIPCNRVKFLNLAKETNDSTLRGLIESFGEISTIIFYVDSTSSRNAIVTFKCLESAKKRLNYATSATIDGNDVQISFFN